MKIFSILIFFITAGLVGTTCGAVAYSQDFSLRNAFNGKLHIGVAVSSRVYMGVETEETRLTAKHFSSVVAENEMKPGFLQPKEGVWTWEKADRFVAFGEKHQMKIIGHCLVWHNETPDWFFKNVDGSPANRETLIARLRSHIHTVVGRYKGRVHGWDVVNEAFENDGTLHPSPWKDGIGDDFIELAFRFAHEADPSAELYYNDFNMFVPAKANGVLKFMAKLREKGVRIDGIGLQGHCNLTAPRVDELESTIRKIGEAGFRAMITELDVSVLPNAWGLSAEIQKRRDYDAKYNPYTKGVPDDVLEQQAKRYRELFEMCLRYRRIIDRVTIWGVSDRMSWLNNYPMRGRRDYPLLFDREWKAKPCFTAVEKLAREWRDTAAFSFFRLEGKDVLEPCDNEKSYRNPIFDGMAADPSITRKGDDYYLAHSSFSYFPGIPIWKSKDLVNWKFVGHVQTRPSQLMLKRGLDMSDGVYAPDIQYNPFNDTFYVIVTVMGCGTYIYTTRDPAQGWSEPIEIKLAGIDPAFHFDENGKAYILNNDLPPPSGEHYPGHRTIRMREYDLKTNRLLPETERILVDKGWNPEAKPVWVEGPHLYKVDGAYYLLTAEGGTYGHHSAAVYCADKIEGPYTPCRVNPILTQRDLDPKRPRPITSTGHADFIETSNGEWFAVFLGVVPYGEAKNGNDTPTGRSTFLLPMKWVGEGKERQPIILEKGCVVPHVVPKTAFQKMATSKNEQDACLQTGNRVFEDSFDSEQLDPCWLQVRTPTETWWRVDSEKGVLELNLRADTLQERGNPSYLCRWLQSRRFSVETELLFEPVTTNDFAGLVLFQNERFNLILGKTLDAKGHPIVQLIRSDGKGITVVASVRLQRCGALLLRAEGTEKEVVFSFRETGGDWQAIGTPQNSQILSSAAAGGYVGATVGLCATSLHQINKRQ